MKYSSQTDKLYKISDSVGLLNEIIKNYSFIKTTPLDIARFQLECLGFISVVLPRLDEKYYLLTNREKNWFTLYQLKTGDTLKIKSRSNIIESNPVEIGDLINVIEIKQEPRYYKNEKDKWCKDFDHPESILKRYSVVKR